MQRRKRVLVTGGAGFVGSYLCGQLLARDNEVICLDNFFTGSRANILPYLTHPWFSVVRLCVTSPIQIEADAIYNLACPASPVHYQRDPVQTIKTSVQGAINVLDLARRLNVPVLQSSTSEVYGDPEIHPQCESYWGNVNPIGPRSCYDEGKRCAETLFFDYKRQYGVDIRIARIFNTYGPRMQPDDGRVISNFVVQALQGKPITIFGDGQQTRSFCYVQELVDGLMRLMDSDPGVTGPMNLGKPTEFTIVELAEMVIRMTGSTSQIIHLPQSEDDPRQRLPDITYARERLGWEPHISLEDGLVPTIAYFRDLLAEGQSVAGLTHG